MTEEHEALLQECIEENELPESLMQIVRLWKKPMKALVPKGLGSYGMTEDDWEYLFRPQPNLIREETWNYASRRGCLFNVDTDSPDFQYLLQIPQGHIWTLIEGDEGQYIVSGQHRVNRIGYFVAERTIEEVFGKGIEEYSIEISLEDLTEEN